LWTNQALGRRIRRYEAKNLGGIMFGIGLQELAVILLIALVIFGPTKLPQIGSGLGKAIRDFKKAVTDDDPEDATKETEKETKDLPR
jgi:sec-independent protein translocase protein TatA